ncbi:hypothetical protein CRG98_030842, partial [Punica granatum]
VVKPFLEPKTYKKVKFVYSDDLNSRKIMEDLFDMDKLESVFGGNDTSGFEIGKYAERMREDDKKIPGFWTPGTNLPSPASEAVIAASLDSVALESDSDSSNNDKAENVALLRMESEEIVESNDHAAETGAANERNVGGGSGAVQRT